MNLALRALVVDDSKDDADLLVRELKRVGYDVEWERVETAADLERSLKERTWDVLLSDFSMPGFSGIDALRIMQRLKLDLPFLIISGTIGEETAVEALKAGAHDFLVKGKLARLQPAIERERREAFHRHEGHRAEQALRESESKYRRIVETAQEGIWALDARLGTTYLNRRMAEMLGGTPEDLLGAPLLQFVHPDGHERIRRAFDPNAKRGSDHQEYKFIRRDESEFWASISATPIADEAGKLSGGLAMVTDVTEQRKLHVQLMVSDRMASVGTLAAGVAHEINNPLAAVLANIDLATREVSERADGGPALDIPELLDELLQAREAARRVRQIVRDLRIFSRSEIDVTGPVDLQSVLESTLRMAWNEIRHRARLVKDFEVVPSVEGNESRLGQVFLNLIVNAAQAIPEGSSESNQIRVRLAQLTDGRVEVSIADTGPGIPPEVQQRLFTPFFTTKPPGVGTGLGLSICHKIISSIGGSIEVDTEVGQGTTFRVILRPAQVEPKVAVAPVVRPTPATRRGRVLVVDDEAMILAAIQRILSPDHEVLTFRNGQQALEQIRGGERYDVILCDLMMPEITGMDFHAEVAKVAQEQAQATIFLTGGAFTSRARAFLDEVKNERIEKPFDAMSLRAIVNERIG